MVPWENSFFFYGRASVIIRSSSVPKGVILLRLCFRWRQHWSSARSMTTNALQNETASSVEKYFSVFVCGGCVRDEVGDAPISGAAGANNI